MSLIQAFLLLPDTENAALLEEKPLHQFMSNLEHIVECAASEKSTWIWYDSENIKAFVNQFDGFEEEYLNNLPERIQDILWHSVSKNWRVAQQHHLENRYFLWDLTKEEAVPLYHQPHTLSEIAERCLQNIENKYVLLNYHSALYIDREMIVVIKDRWSAPDLPKFILIPFIHNADELADWFKRNRQERKFHRFRPGEPKKHPTSDKSVKYLKGNKVSPLLCNDDEAQRLLDDAIGDRRESKKLYAFDKTRNKYIVFEDEETLDNQYHGYHVDEIPEHIRRRIQS